jgi:hypothetical protein
MKDEKMTTTINDNVQWEGHEESLSSATNVYSKANSCDVPIIRIDDTHNSDVAIIEGTTTDQVPVPCNNLVESLDDILVNDSEININAKSLKRKASNSLVEEDPATSIPVVTELKVAEESLRQQVSENVSSHPTMNTGIVTSEERYKRTRRVVPARISWEERMAALIAYKEEYGHLQIPIRYKKNPSLGKFVHNTREQYKLFRNQCKMGYQKRCSLTEERISDLNRIGFIWTTERIKKQTDDWNARLEQLKEYKAKHGVRMIPISSFKSGKGRLFFSSSVAISGLLGSTWVRGRSKFCRMDSSTTYCIRFDGQGRETQSFGTKSNGEAGRDWVQFYRSFG